MVVVPEVRKSFGWQPVARPPTTYPRKPSITPLHYPSPTAQLLNLLLYAVPSRARDTSLEGYDDDWKPQTA